ncbi:MAG TPA: hypothetical protein VJ792_08640 [Candidatus Nitrosotalea sp.]|nr:hypothetical protein [Candidatus Nitrosotalea sp.]
MGLVGVELADLCARILDVNSSIRHVSVINSRGRAVEEVSRGGQSVFYSGDQKEMLLMQCSLTISMGRDFDQSFGKINYVHMERENLSLYSFPLGDHVVLVASKAATGPISLARDVLSILKESTRPRKTRPAEPLVEAIHTR